MTHIELHEEYQYLNLIKKINNLKIKTFNKLN